MRLVDEKGARRALIPAGWMRDAKGVESRAVRYELTKAGDTWVLGFGSIKPGSAIRLGCSRRRWIRRCSSTPRPMTHM